MKKVLILGFFLCVLPVYAGGKFDGRDLEEISEKGHSFYEEGKYKEASEYLLHALNNDYFLHSSDYAHICLNELDGKKHKTSEAARWSIKAAEVEGGESWAALNALDPMIVSEESDKQLRIQRLKECWRREQRAYTADEGYTYWIRSTEVEDKKERKEISKKAARLLKRAAQGNHPLAQGLYSQICSEGSDEKFHLLSESAGWLFCAARGGAPDAAAYMQTIFPKFRDVADIEKTIKHITTCWILGEVFYDIPLIKPASIIQYLIKECKSELDITSAQKTVYYFEKFLFALTLKIGSPTNRIVEETPVPHAEGGSPTKRAKMETPQSMLPLPCGFEPLLIIKEQPSAWTYGPVYLKYFQNLKDKSGTPNGSIITAEQHKKLRAPEIKAPFLQTALQVYSGVIKGKKAGEWVELSHEEYPWLKAGVLYWKEKHKKPFDMTSLKEEDLLEKLDTFEEISAYDIGNIRKEIDPPKKSKEKVGWKNSLDSSSDPIVQSFQDGLQGFFASALSQNHKIVQDSIKAFSESTKTLRLHYMTDKEILKDKLRMHLCEEMILNGVGKKGSLKALKKSARYFTNMRTLSLFGFPSNLPRDDWKRFIKALRKKGIDVRN